VKSKFISFALSSVFVFAVLAMIPSEGFAQEGELRVVDEVIAQVNDDALLEANWQEYATHLLRAPRPTVKGIQQVIDSGTIGKVDVKAERLVDMSLVDELEKSGFIDAVYKE